MAEEPGNSGASETQSGDAFEAKPTGGGGFNLGWGCLPVLIAGAGLLPLLGL